MHLFCEMDYWLTLTIWQGIAFRFQTRHIVSLSTWTFRLINLLINLHSSQNHRMMNIVVTKNTVHSSYPHHIICWTCVQYTRRIVAYAQLLMSCAIDINIHKLIRSKCYLRYISPYSCSLSLPLSFKRRQRLDLVFMFILTRISNLFSCQ